MRLVSTLRTLAALSALSSLNVGPALAQWANGQNAFRVIGQANFTSSTTGTTATTLNTPNGVCLDRTNNKLYVVDGANHRVLRFAYPVTSDQPTAERVFGQANATSAVSATTQSGMSTPYGCAVDATGRLWVAEFGNRRVIWFNSAHTAATDGPNANGVLGKADFTDTAFGATQNQTSQVTSVSVDAAGTLWVADHGNRRVLRFANAASKSNGAIADGVLGQANFTSATSAATQNGMNRATEVFADAAGRLWVLDNQLSRVLRFDNATSKADADGADADRVLGQTTFTGTGTGTTASTLNFPVGLTGDGDGRIYVADGSNNRVVIYSDAANKTNGASADNVLGQANLTSLGSAVTQAGLTLNASRSAMAVDNPSGVLWVVDRNAHRVVGYQASTSLPVELVAFTASSDRDAVRLSWTTAAETNNAGFAVERQAGHAWQEVGFVTGRGTTAERTTYSHTITGVTPGTYSFRLRQVDFDGTTSYSSTVEVTVGLDTVSLVEVRGTSVHFAVRETQAVRVDLFNGLGQRVATLFDGEAPAGLTRSLDAPIGLSAGVYLVRVSGRSVAETARLVVR